MKPSILIVLLSVSAIFSIGYQHGTFVSQSTQGTAWRGSSSIITEHYTITVMPSYLDVELDWEFDCNGTEPDSFKNALEIVGNLNLAQDAAVTGMLLWNGDEILKAKLKPIQLAREQYEEVVDRDAPAPTRPRDPVIFEYGWGDDNYDISIFPVTWQGSRKLRMRYVIPALNMSGHADIPFPTAFNRSIASYSIKAGPGVSSIEFVNNNGNCEDIGVSAEFESGSELYSKVVLVRPKIPEIEGSSVFYTTTIDKDDFSGSLTHVIGCTGQQILAKVDMNIDYVILWRWNHPEFAPFYLKQIVRQSGFLKEFFNHIAGKNKRVALIVDRAGNARTTFELGTSGDDSFKQMVAFVDSLSQLEFTDNERYYNPGYSQQQIDSIVRLSIEEFEGSIRLALSLFDEEVSGLRKIIVLTAGPAWIRKYTYNNNLSIDPDVEIATFQTLAASGRLSGITFPKEVLDFYWPGIYQNSIVRNNDPFTLEAVLYGESGTEIVIPVSASTTTSYYRWDVISPHLDKKLHSNQKLMPIITWRISKNGTQITEFTEEPAVMTMEDPVQFACALAGTGTLESIDGTPPTSLAATFGFVDRQYALLALEEDVMETADQEQYRISGVPPLTNADIFEILDDEVPPEQQNTVDAHEATPVAASKELLPKKSTPEITLQRSHLIINFIGTQHVKAQRATISVYTLSGRLLYYTQNKEINNGVIRLNLSEVLHISQQSLIVTVNVNGMTFTKKVALRL